MIRLVFVLVPLAFSIPAAYAQDEDPRPFTTRTVSKPELIMAARLGDPSILNTSCEDMAAAAHKIGFIRSNSCESLVSYYQRLQVAPCPQTVTTTLARVMSDDSIDLYGFKRSFREGEMCLYDNQEVKWVASLSCGNFITGDPKGMSVYTAMQPGAQGSASAEDRPASDSTRGAFDDAALRRAAQEAARLAEEERARAGQQSGDAQPLKKKNYWQRNRKWIIPVIAGATAGATAAIFVRPWNENENENSTTVNIGR